MRLCPWPRAFLSLVSKVSVVGKAVLGLGLGFFLYPLPWPRALCPRLHLCKLWCNKCSKIFAYLFLHVFFCVFIFVHLIQMTNLNVLKNIAQIRVRKRRPIYIGEKDVTFFYSCCILQSIQATLRAIMMLTSSQRSKCTWKNNLLPLASISFRSTSEKVYLLNFCHVGPDP